MMVEISGLKHNRAFMDDHVRQLLLLGREHYHRGEYEKAEYVLRQVIAKSDRHADVHHMLGVIAHSAGEFARAESHFEKAVFLNPNYTEAQLNLMVTYNDLGKYDAARRIYSQIRARTVTSQPDPFIKGKLANMHAELSQAYVDVGMVPEAIRELEKAVNLCPHFADLQTRLGVLFRDSGDLSRATQCFATAKQANARYVPGRLALGTLLLGSGEMEAARREFEAVLEVEPDNRLAHTYLRLTHAAPRTSNPPPDEPA
jgi:tetratricopeptide (TPR) repeat protein